MSHAAGTARRVLIERLELFARERPAEYRLRVTALAVLGLGFRALVWFAIFSVPLVLTIAIYPAGWAFALLAGVALVFIAAGMRAPRLDGERVDAAQAPELFTALEALRQRTRAPHVDEVRLTREFNASAALVPRLGALGWNRQILTLGIPLLAALSREQVLAVVGHELGHFSKAHGRLGHWIYRTRYGWEKLRAEFAGETRGLGGAVNQFYVSFVPYFSAYSFVLARMNEYEADADAALASDAGTACTALAAVHAYGDYVATVFWPSLRRTALASPEPPADVYARLAKAVRTASAEQIETLRSQALKRISDLADTHPCLADRLRALGVADAKVAAAQVCAGRAFFGNRWDDILERASAEWRTLVAREWSDQHRRLRDLAARLRGLRAAPDSLAVRIERARITEALEGPDAALEHWRPLRAEHPDDVRVAFEWARTLAGQRERDALALLDDIAARYAGYAAPAAEAAKELALALGDTEAADRYESGRRAAAAKEARVTPKFLQALRQGGLDEHRLPGHGVALLVQQLQADGCVAGAYVARIRCAEAAGFGALYLLVRIDPEPMRAAARDTDDILARCRSLVQPLLEPNEFVWLHNFFTTEAVPENIAARLAELPSSRLYGDLASPEGVRIDPRNLA